MVHFSKGVECQSKHGSTKTERSRITMKSEKESKLLPAFSISNKHNRTPSISTTATEKTTKSNRSWKLPRMNSTSSISSKIGRMTKKQNKTKESEIPAVPALPKSILGMQNGKKDNLVEKTKLQSGSTSHLVVSSSIQNESCTTDPAVLQPPMPAFLGFKQRRASSRSSITSNSESDSEVCSERSLSTYTTSTAHSPIYFSANSSFNNVGNHSPIKQSTFGEESQEHLKESKGGVKDVLRSFKRKVKNQMNDKMDRSPTVIESNQIHRNPIMPIIRASSSAPQLCLGLNSTDLDPFRSSPMHLPDTLPLSKKEQEDGKNVEEKGKSSFSNEVRQIFRLEKDLIKAEETKNLVQFGGSPISRPKNHVFFSGITTKEVKTHRLSNLQSVESDDDYGTEENLNESNVVVLTAHNTVEKVSPGQSPMLSPTTLLPPTPPFAPIKNEIGLITPGRKALYTCTVRKLHPQLTTPNTEGQMTVLLSPRSVNQVKLLEKHHSTTGHLRSLSILLARTRVARRLKNSSMNQEQDKEIEAFVAKGYLNAYLSPKEVVIKLMQRSNIIGQAEALVRPPLQNPSSSTLPSGMAIWISRPTFIKRKRNFVIEEKEDGISIIDKPFDSTVSETLSISDRCKILAGNKLENVKSGNEKSTTKSTLATGNLTNRTMQKSRNKEEEQSEMKDDDVPLALLRARRWEISGSPLSSKHSSTVCSTPDRRTSSIITPTDVDFHLSVHSNLQEENLRKLENNKRLISEARQRRQQNEHPSMGKPFSLEGGPNMQSKMSNAKKERRSSDLIKLEQNGMGHTLPNVNRMKNKFMNLIDEETTKDVLKDIRSTDLSGRKQRKPSLSTPPRVPQAVQIHSTLLPTIQNPLDINGYMVQPQAGLQSWSKPEQNNPFYNFPHIGPMMYPNLALTTTNQQRPTLTRSNPTRTIQHCLTDSHVIPSSNSTPKRPSMIIHSQSDNGIALRTQRLSPSLPKPNRQFDNVKKDFQHNQLLPKRSPLSQNVYNASTNR